MHAPFFKGRTGVFTALAAAVLLLATAAHRGSASSSAVQTVPVTEATNSAATVSPDHRSIVMDVQGVLWSIPFGGGAGTQLTDALVEAARPDFSPRGDRVAFQAYKGGTFHIWTIRPNGSDLRQITFGHGDDREPRMSPDGTKVAFASDRAFAGSYDIWVADLSTGALTQWTRSPADEFEPAWSPDGREIAFVSGTGANGTTIQARDAAGNQRVLATAATGTRVNSPSWSPDGAKIAYLQFASNKSNLLVNGAQVGASNDVFPFFPQWLSNDALLYTADGKIRATTLSSGATREIPFQVAFALHRPSYRHKRFDLSSGESRRVLGIVGPTLSPDGKRVAFEALNQIWVMEIGDQPKAVTRGLYYKCDPAWSPDGTRLAYASDKNGTMDLYVLDWRSGAEKRVTAIVGAEVSPAWSPDGRSLAYQDETGATWTVEIATGAVKKVITALFAPSKPTWHASGKTIAVAALKPYTKRFREGTSQILTVDLASGALTYQEPAPFESFSTRGEDGPVYSPDGTAVAAVMHSQLYVIPVDASGHVAGPARKLNGEVTDAPTWSGDSRSLLYLSNGKLRRISRSGGEPQTVPLDLSFKPEQHRGRVVIHAGAVWDGRGPEVQHDMDIVVVGQRIQSIRPHRGHGDDQGEHEGDDDDGEGTRSIDATKQTVIPGLWEAHTHQYIEGKYYGDRLGRLWMAYGVTSLQSVGDPAYRAPETRESFAAGARVGPRYFATGEALDGERVYYNFMRPITSEAQLKLELSRGKALDYDMIKTYVRLPHAWQKEAIAYAHALGVFTGGHYMMPQLSFGGDGMTHVSATTRTGFAYTRSSAGVSYRDMTDLFSKAEGAFDISTTFNASLYAEDPAMVDDPRLQILNTPWDEAALRAKRDFVLSHDQTVSLDSLRKEEATVKRIQTGGGTILAGTDSPLDNVATALHLNLRAQVKYGLAPWQALQSATLKPARMYNVSADLGTIEDGKLADLTFINGDPLTTIKDLANVAGVMKGGRYYSVADLMKPFMPAHAAPAKDAPRHQILAPVVHPGEAPWWHDPEQMIEEEHKGAD